MSNEIEITEHARVKYVTRIEGVENRKEAKRIAVADKDRIDEHISKLYEYSSFVYRGQLGGDKTTGDYYLNNETALVVKENRVITLFKIEFPFPKEAVSVVIESLVNEITKMNDTIDKIEKEIEEESVRIDKDILDHETKIEQLEAELEWERECLEFAKTERSRNYKRNQINKAKQKEWAYQLFGNTDLKVVK